MATGVEDVLKIMLNAARDEAGAQWTTASAAITSEIKVFGQRLTQIAVGRASQELSDQDAREFFVVIQNNLISMIAMTTTLVFAAAQKIINAALAAAKQTINALVNFPLILA